MSPPAGLVPVSPLAEAMPSPCLAGLTPVPGSLEGSTAPRCSQGSWCSCLTIRNWTAAPNSFLTSHLARHQMVNTFSPCIPGLGGGSDLKVKDCLALPLSLGVAGPPSLALLSSEGVRSRGNKTAQTGVEIAITTSLGSCCLKLEPDSFWVGNNSPILPKAEIFQNFPKPWCFPEVS